MTRLVVAASLLWVAPLAAQDVPPPGDWRGALTRADSLYREAIELVEAARGALERKDGAALDEAVRAYRRVMPFALVWHGRACWSEDSQRRRLGRGGVAYPMQATMGEVMVGWGIARFYMTQEASVEVLRESYVEGLASHAATLRAVVDELRRDCLR